MSTTTLDKAGRIVIPKDLRDELRLEPGDALEVGSDGERLTLRPVRSASPLRKEQGVWVFRSGKRVLAAETDRLLEDLRYQRAGTDRRGSRG
jgi:AbrB family looped-hinge helix DNA binding protein